MGKKRKGGTGQKAHIFLHKKKKDIFWGVGSLARLRGKSKKNEKKLCIMTTSKEKEQKWLGSLESGFRSRITN